MDATRKITLTVDEDGGGSRLDSYIAAACGEFSRSAAAKLMSAGCVSVSGRIESKNYRVVPGDVIILSVPDVKPMSAAPEDIPLDVVYEDDDIIVINKPSGMVVHPAAGNPDHTLVNALMAHCGDSLSGIGGELRPGIVHRIDKDTSGLLVVAKNDNAHRELSSQLAGHHISREYRALVNGGFSTDSGKIDLPIGRSPSDRKKMAVIRDETKRSRNAVTHYRVLERFGGISYLSLQLETGRTHQIRVHMASCGHPLIGDSVYGRADSRFEREHASLISGQCLHAISLTFTHPSSGEVMTFHAPLPQNFEKLLQILRSQEQ